MCDHLKIYMLLLMQFCSHCYLQQLAKILRMHVKIGKQ